MRVSSAADIHGISAHLNNPRQFGNQTQSSCWLPYACIAQERLQSQAKKQPDSRSGQQPQGFALYVGSYHLPAAQGCNTYLQIRFGGCCKTLLFL